MIRELHLEITRRCLLQCPKCPRTYTTGYKIDDLSYSNFKELVETLQPKVLNFCGNLGDPIFHKEIDKFANEVLLPDMKKVFADASIEKKIIGEIVGFDREDKSDACEFISSLTGDNSRQVVSFGTEAGLYQEIGISTVVCGPGSIEQAHKIDEYIVLDELKKCINLLDGIKNNSTLN